MNEHAEDTEARFLAMIREAPGDRAARLIYADWLEEQGQRDRAEYLRIGARAVLLRPDRHRTALIEQQMDKLARARPSDAAWRTLVSITTIRGCERSFIECPERWSALTPTPESDVRHCATCARNIYFCATPNDARECARTRELVALDRHLASSLRFEYDQAVPWTREERLARRREREGPVSPAVEPRADGLPQRVRVGRRRGTSR